MHGGVVALAALTMCAAAALVVAAFVQVLTAAWRHDNSAAWARRQYAVGGGTARGEVGRGWQPGQLSCSGVAAAGLGTYTACGGPRRA
eukprot:1692140-Rhodomonas_salina.3